MPSVLKDTSPKSWIFSFVPIGTASPPPTAQMNEVALRADIFL